MDPLQLLADLEGLRDKIPAALSADYENLIVSIRNIYEMSIKFVTPPEPVHAGKNNLASYHTAISDLCIQLENSLLAFQQVYVGKGSDAYHMTATASLQNLQLIRTHLETATFLHNVMATNFELVTEAKIALIALLVGLVITLAVLIASAGSTAPVTVPAAVIEAAGGAISIGIMTEAEAAALAAIMGLVWASLPTALLSGLAATGVTEALGHIGDSYGYMSKKGDKGDRKDTANQQEKVEFEYAWKEIQRRLKKTLSRGDRRRLHDEITKQGFTPEEIIEIGVAMFGDY